MSSRQYLFSHFTRPKHCSLTMETRLARRLYHYTISCSSREVLVRGCPSGHHGCLLPIVDSCTRNKIQLMLFSIGFRGILYYVKSKRENTLSLGYTFLQYVGLFGIIPSPKLETNLRHSIGLTCLRQMVCITNGGVITRIGSVCVVAQIVRGAPFFRGTQNVKDNFRCCGFGLGL